MWVNHGQLLMSQPWLRPEAIDTPISQNLHLKTELFTAAEALRSRGLVVVWCVFVFCFSHLSLDESLSH